MVSISEIIASNAGSLSEEYRSSIAEPNHALDKLSEKLHDEFRDPKIFGFSVSDSLVGKSLVAVDGGRTTTQLSAGDLIVVGATLGQSWNGVHLYDEESIPAEAVVKVIPHMSGNSELGGHLMAACELLLLEQAESDVKIIDGAYIGNVTQLLFGLVNKNPMIHETILNMFGDDESKWEALNRSMLKVLTPPRDNSSLVVAVTKSDSSFVYSKELLGEGNPLSQMISDRILASRVLFPGEFLYPRSLAQNETLIRALGRLSDHPLVGDRESVLGRRWHLLVETGLGGEKNKKELLERLNKNTDKTEEKRLWTTYFKPTAWPESAPVIKIEFHWYPSSTTNPADHARRLVELVNQDVLAPEVLEPWSQFEADRRAKDVSIGTEIARQTLVAGVGSQREAEALLRGYRT